MFTPAYQKFLFAIVQQSIFICLLLGSVLALAAGLLLIFNSERAFRIGDWLNRWVSTRAAFRPLDEPRNISRPLYRMHRLVGTLICAGALYALVVLGSPYGEMAISKSLGSLGPPRFVEWISESLRIALLAGNFGALIFGAVFIVRPSALKGLEAWSDRWISGRGVARPLEAVRLPADRFVRRHPRLTGALVTLGSLYALANLGFALLSGR